MLHLLLRLWVLLCLNRLLTVLASSELLGLILLSLVELVYVSVHLVSHREITEVVVA